MRTERLQPGYQGPLCTGYHQVMSDGAAASRSQDRGWVVVGGGIGGRKGKGAQEKQIGMFPEETGSTKKEEKKGKEKKTNESEAMIADLSHRCATGGFSSYAVMTQRQRMSLTRIQTVCDGNDHSSSFVITKCM